MKVCFTGYSLTQSQAGTHTHTKKISQRSYVMSKDLVFPKVKKKKILDKNIDPGKASFKRHFYERPLKVE